MRSSASIVCVVLGSCILLSIRFVSGCMYSVPRALAMNSRFNNIHNEQINLHIGRHTSLLGRAAKKQRYIPQTYHVLARTKFFFFATGLC